MATILNANKDKDGRVIVRIFRTDYDVTDKLVNGIATLEVYGQIFEIHADAPKAPAKPAVVKKAVAKKAPANGKKIAVKARKDNGEKVEVGFIESPDED